LGNINFLKILAFLIQ